MRRFHADGHAHACFSNSRAASETFERFSRHSSRSADARAGDSVTRQVVSEDGWQLDPITKTAAGVVSGKVSMEKNLSLHKQEREREREGEGCCHLIVESPFETLDNRMSL